MRAYIGNAEVAKKLDDSESGYALLTAAYSVQESLVHFVCRAWDSTKNTNSVLKVSKIIGVPDGSPLEVTIDRLSKDSRLAAIKLLRNEWFAHLSEGTSSTRQGLEKRGHGVISLRRSEVAEFATETVRTIAEMRYVQEKVRIPVERRLVEAEQQSRALWEVLPVLAHVESKGIS